MDNTMDIGLAMVKSLRAWHALRVTVQKLDSRKLLGRQDLSLVAFDSVSLKLRPPGRPTPCYIYK